MLLDNPGDSPGNLDWSSSGTGSGEYFLIENRRNISYDFYLPGSGLLIWHIDESVGNNRNESHKLVDLEEADGLNHLDYNNINTGDKFDPWYSSVTGFTNIFNPNSKLYNGSASNISVTNISGSGYTMTANLNVASSDWQYSRKLTITGTTAGAQTNYQMKLAVHNISGTDTPNTVYLNGSARNDFGDLRFTRSDGVTLLDYWIESYTSGVSAVVWVEVDSIPASPGTVDIYLYYGNPSATSLSSADNTLLFYDGFESGSLSKWSQIGNPVILGSAAWEGGYGVKSTGDARDYIYKNWAGQPQKIVIDFAFKKNSNDGYGGAAWGGGNYRIIGINTVTYNRFVVVDGNYHTLGAWDSIWHTAAIKIAGNSTKYYLDGAEKYTTSGSTSVNQINFYSAGPAGNFYFDYIRIYKYESPEPVWA